MVSKSHFPTAIAQRKKRFAPFPSTIPRLLELASTGLDENWLCAAVAAAPMSLIAIETQRWRMFVRKTLQRQDVMRYGMVWWVVVGLKSETFSFYVCCEIPCLQVGLRSFDFGAPWGITTVLEVKFHRMDIRNTTQTCKQVKGYTQKKREQGKVWQNRKAEFNSH